MEIPEDLDYEESLSEAVEDCLNEGDKLEEINLRQTILDMKKQINDLVFKVESNDSQERGSSSHDARNNPSDVIQLFSPNRETASADLDKQIQELLTSDHSDNEGTGSVFATEENKTEVILNSLIADLDKNKTVGPSIQANLAKLIQGLCSDGLAESQLKEKMGKYHRPSNVEMLQTTTVNNLFWQNLHLKTKREDIKLQKLQLFNIKGITVLTYLLNDAVSSKASLDKETLLKGLTDALAFFCAGNKNLNIFRRELIKPELKTEFQGLCSSSVPFTTKLFGDDVSKKVTDISDANKVSRRCLDHNVSRRRDMMPFRGRGRGSSRGRQPRYQPYPDRPFLGRGRSRGSLRPPYPGKNMTTRR